MKNIYCISGLGADHRVFGKIDIPGAQLIAIPWPVPDSVDSIASYATKIIALIKEERPVILGVSLGGILGLEIAKQIPVTKVFMVSSAKTPQELAGREGHIIAFIMKYGLVPTFILRHPFGPVFTRFGACSQDDKKLFSAIMRDTDPAFVQWAFTALLGWKNDTIPGGIIHIHGTNDRIIPSRLAKPDYWIKGGTHFMIYNRAEELSRIIAKEL